MADAFESIRANLRNLASPKNVEVGRNLVASISELVAQAAGEASRNLQSESASEHSTPLTLEHQILQLLSISELSSISLRKKLTEMAAGEIPNQEKLKLSLQELSDAGLISLGSTGDKKSYRITDKGTEHLEAHATKLHSAHKAQTKCECSDKQDALAVMRKAQRLSSTVLDASINGTSTQRLLVAQELERTRLAILKILAGEKLD